MALMNAWFWNTNEPEGCMALKNAGFGKVNGLEECMALKYAWFREREWTAIHYRCGCLKYG